MFSSLKLKIVLGIYIFLILSIPVGAYLASQQQSATTSAKQEKKPVTKPIEEAKPLPTPVSQKTIPDELPGEKATTQATTFGPTLNLKLTLEGRPAAKMASKIFIGIAEAAAQTNLKYLLSFNIDLPDSGEFNGLSLAGLTTGSNYQAVIKGPAQIATSSAFIMSPTQSNLNSNQPIFLLTGDLNEDNVINSADYSIAKTAFGAKPNSANWNENIDFNVDGIINSADIAIIIKNMAKTGDSGLWISQVASGSASLLDQTPAGSVSAEPVYHPSGSSGYWLWVPGF
ncbi:hypothetical protein A3F00_03720 [Candidatus Daviesbacteria bacterium RIFCSPHIGHO2_12_FULL_37_11]|uniref:Dockerin domain-containing protein n=1 Tax=Candidatus Daviesbacteria bacterium RIFCSPHIGHO2_12_FULL_37_11 TaxID=1797777 RepID=A0A1F5KDI6_9BACT|nr:MAG: hypothetical protein A2769_00370 [Candidatus Daviesbacteria bacterium RIFCSPHIGHO2_01_FULL_37_27]OGE38651.1 MAG: hypothetical protein A3F00_03720 [Candidatus Daviesbacteria bacterium RIFCSPHIGHO2_12_FULL_37_11]OGE45975.1 MAG: hypothetical protein A3B39_02990 [Candidatus Daviesbacteria bacterium RIFCSPLOWO2_01_FULL_37_10]